MRNKYSSKVNSTIAPGDYVKLAYAYGNFRAKTAEISDSQIAGLALGGAALGGGLMYLNNENKKKQKAVEELIKSKELNQNVIKGLISAAPAGLGVAAGLMLGKTRRGVIGKGALGFLAGGGLGYGAADTFYEKAVPGMYGKDSLEELNRRDAERAVKTLSQEEIDWISALSNSEHSSIIPSLLAKRGG